MHKTTLYAMCVCTHAWVWRNRNLHIKCTKEEKRKIHKIVVAGGRKVNRNFACVCNTLSLK